MNDVTNKTLVYLLMIAIVVSLVGTLVSLSKLGELGITGMATNTSSGEVNLSITGACSVSMTGGNNISFGSGAVSGSPCILNTSAGTKSGGCGTGINAVTHGINFTNDGNQNISLNISSNVTAANFIGGSNPVFKIDANEVESGACNFGNFSLNWNETNTSDMELCSSSNQLEPNDDNDTLEIDVYLSIPTDSNKGGGQARLTVTGICSG